MKNIGQAEWTHWNVRTLPVEWKNHLQHAHVERHVSSVAHETKFTANVTTRNLTGNLQ